MTEIGCPNCGERNPADSSFCSNCGAPLPSSEPPVVARHAYEENVQELPPAQAAAEPEGVEGQSVGAARPGGAKDRLQQEHEAAAMAGPVTTPRLVLEDSRGEPTAVQEVEPVPSGLIGGPPEDTTFASVETEYYAGPLGIVTSEHIIVGAKSYETHAIASAEMEARPAHRRLSLSLAALGAVVILFALVGTFQDPSLGLLLTVGGLILLGFGIFLTATARAAWVVRLHGPAGTVEALASPDRQEVDAMVRAIQAATAASQDHGPAS
jgi:hypothetical protein